MCWKQIYLTRVKQIVLLGIYNSDYENEAKDFFLKCLYFLPFSNCIYNAPSLQDNFSQVLFNFNYKFLISVSSLFLLQILEQKEVDVCVWRMLCRPVAAVWRQEKSVTKGQVIGREHGHKMSRT